MSTFIPGTAFESEINSGIFFPDKENDINLNLTHYKFEKNFTNNQKVIIGLRPEYVSNNETNNQYTKKLSLKPSIIETTGFDKNVTFEFAGNEIIGRFTPNSGVELNISHDVYFDVSQISIFDSESELRL